MSEGAKTIHKANPQVLVVVSGLNYDTEFHFLKRKHLKLNIGKKLVYETHLYSWSGVGILNLKETWTMQPLNKICANSLEALDNQVGFLRSGSDAAPLIFSEFGFDESGSNEEDNNFLTCLQTYLVGNDLDWGLWAFQGSYYLRDDKAQVDENFGLMDSSWTHLRYPNFNEKFQLLIRKIQGFPVTLSNDCKSKNSSWIFVSPSKLHLATTNIQSDGEYLCLQKDSNSPTILTSKCICIEDDDDSTCLNNPQSQWFQLVPTNNNVQPSTQAMFYSQPKMRDRNIKTSSYASKLCKSQSLVRKFGQTVGLIVFFFTLLF
ncbi:glycosyl hydrolase 5 family protein-like isoform X2 [Arachis stenosperma]|uniref:glycosyl hydrolase 5 family protein-like isoform X2 n=1 Tax=Arachis stenosperma TaxID=217475 RepID=UPI0025AC8D01|nr:glycosyl hydrolase 5 family protein-like isoform X2 [Arachis stenosperma]